MMKKILLLIFVILLFLFSACTSDSDISASSTTDTRLPTEASTTTAATDPSAEIITVNSLMDISHFSSYKDLYDYCKEIKKNDKSFTEWHTSRLLFWIDEEGNHVTAEYSFKDSGEFSLTNIVKCVPKEPTNEGLAKIKAGMSIYEVVELVGIPYMEPFDTARDPMAFKTPDGSECHVYLDIPTVYVEDVEIIDNDLEVTIARLEQVISEKYSLDDFEFHRAYLVPNLEKENPYEADQDLRLEGVYFFGEEEWGISITLIHQESSADIYFDVNNDYLIYNRVATDEHKDIVTYIPTYMAEAFIMQIEDLPNINPNW